MQVAAERHTSSLLSVRGLGSGTAAVFEASIVSINSGDNAGISAFVNDPSSGFARMFEFEPQNIFSVTSNDLNDFPGAMAGHVDAMNSAHDINKSPSFRFSSSIYAVDTSKLLSAGTFSETAGIKVEADTSKSHIEDFISGFECFIGGESGSFGGGGGGGYDIRYRRNPIRI